MAVNASEMCRIDDDISGVDVLVKTQIDSSPNFSILFVNIKLIKRLETVLV